MLNHLDCIVTKKCIVLPPRQWWGIFTVIGCVGIVQSCLLGGSEWTLGSMILLRGWSDTGTAFLQKVANASCLSVFKRQFGQCPQQFALTSGQSCNGQAVRIGCYRSIPTGTRAGVLCLLFSHLHQPVVPHFSFWSYPWQAEKVTHLKEVEWKMQCTSKWLPIGLLSLLQATVHFASDPHSSMFPEGTCSVQ